MTSDTAQPIALLYAGSSTTTIGNPISDVISALGVSFVGGNTHSVSCPATSAPRGKVHNGISAAALGRATAVKNHHAQRLTADPAVIGVGVGASGTTRSEAAILIYVEQGRAHGSIPTELNGIRAQVIRTDAFRAYG